MVGRAVKVGFELHRVVHREGEVRPGDGGKDLLVVGRELVGVVRGDGDAVGFFLEPEEAGLRVPGRAGAGEDGRAAPGALEPAGEGELIVVRESAGLGRVDDIYALGAGSRFVHATADYARPGRGRDGIRAGADGHTANDRVRE